MDVLDILNESGDLKPIKDWPKIWRTTLSGLDIAAIQVKGKEALLKKIKWPYKIKNLNLLGKHIAVQAFREQISNEHTGKAGNPIGHITHDMTPEQVAEAYQN
ncbi:hypothetical protein ARAF_0815 [Arsenophonus endosymbiont of Aleurodicus floccissimus]|nr:hypothetical protein ARAF_0815 [Arsenophonus endosymbiont of Aleurodicus floccissimus]